LGWGYLEIVIKKVAFLIFLPMIAEVVIACCDCGVPLLKNYSNQFLAVDNLDNSGEEPVVTTLPTVPKLAYGVRIYIKREIVACNHPVTPGFIQSAYAFSCDCPPALQIAAKDSIVAINLLSAYDFDADHVAGSDVTEYFRVFEYRSFRTVNEYLEDQNGFDDHTISRWTLEDESQLDFKLTMLLMKAPAIQVSNKFRIRVAFSDGRVLEQETTAIDLI